MNENQYGVYKDNDKAYIKKLDKNMTNICYVGDYKQCSRILVYYQVDE